MAAVEEGLRVWDGVVWGGFGVVGGGCGEGRFLGLGGLYRPITIVPSTISSFRRTIAFVSTRVQDRTTASEGLFLPLSSASSMYRPLPFVFGFSL